MVEYDQVGSKNRIAVTSTGAWSTSELLPMGVLEDLRTGRMMAWQVEHNGAWHYELGDRYGHVYLTVAGPTGAEHQWAAHLDAGESFRTVPVAVGVVHGGWDQLGSALTAHRRRIRRPHPDNVELPIIYNDFLNCLMSDPTTERELPLIEAARDLGAEVFCIDAGWYDDEDGGWWDSVGEWVPSVQRFPDGGLAGLVKRIRDAGMRVGLWMEPEVVGVRSPLAAELPDEAFFTRGGRRVMEWGRYQLDLRHPAAQAHLDKTVDRLMADFSLDYLKLDYNIDIGAGTDGSVGDPVGAGLLGHNRAFVEWVDGIMERHPGLTVEGCAAGGSRMDGASGALFPILSLTDQQDFRKMPPIAGAASTAVTPEQSGVWASVAGWMTDEDLAYSVTTSALGRIHLAGRIDTLDERQRDIVRRGLAAYRALRDDITTSTPVWPLGLPGWRDGLISYGLRSGDVLYVAVWRRSGHRDVRIPLPAWLGCDPRAEVLYPDWAGAENIGVVGDDATLALTLPDVPCARLLRLSAVNPNGGNT
jgi:alpha-galactosidase